MRTYHNNVKREMLSSFGRGKKLIDKFCYGVPDASTKLDPLTFYAYRMNNVVDVCSIASILDKHDLSEMEHAMMRYMITNNILYNDRYIRCSEHGYFLTDDISVPFYGFTKYIQKVKLEYDFENLSHDDKILYIEECFVNNDYEKLRDLQTLFLEHDDCYYHVLQYRSTLSKCYNALVPVGSSPMGPMRVFRDGVWSNAEYTEELAIRVVY